MATGYDPLFDDEPELARPMVASVKQRFAFGEHAGEKGIVSAQALATEGQQSCPLPTQWQKKANGRNPEDPAVPV